MAGPALTPHDLARRARKALALRAGSLDEALADADLEPVVNWGGFVNRSFRVRAGPREYHLKLASDPVGLRKLEQWRSLAPVLERRYRAPEMVAWVDVPDTPFAGPLFRRVEGRSPEALTPALVEVVLPLLADLRRDGDLRGRLQAIGHVSRSCARVYLDTLHDRFTEDLKGVEAAPPPFVDEARLRWMWEEVRRLEMEVRASEAFREPARAPTHGDLWLDNILVGSDGDLHVLDWDGLAPADPVMDLAVFLGPSRGDLRTALEREEHLPDGLSGPEKLRLGIWARATLLDWVVDSLADWVEAEREPEEARRIREPKERIHEAALDHYRSLHG